MNRWYSVHMFFLIFIFLSMQGQGIKVYPGIRGEKVVIHSTTKAEATPESRLEVFDKDRRFLCALDYSSEDGEHGYGVEKAVWTMDKKYFVVSLASSGGHQAWHSPTIAYSSDKKWIISLDDFIDGLGITGSNFELINSHNVATHMLKNKEIPINLNLDDLFRHAVMAKIAKGLGCSAGKIRKVGDRF
jgi:hypothetical protein